MRLALYSTTCRTISQLTSKLVITLLPARTFFVDEIMYHFYPYAYLTTDELPRTLTVLWKAGVCIWKSCNDLWRYRKTLNIFLPFHAFKPRAERQCPNCGAPVPQKPGCTYPHLQLLCVALNRLLHLAHSWSDHGYPKSSTWRGSSTFEVTGKFPPRPLLRQQLWAYHHHRHSVCNQIFQPFCHVG